jgi:hypothetical protein
VLGNIPFLPRNATFNDVVQIGQEAANVSVHVPVPQPNPVPGNPDLTVRFIFHVNLN